MPRRPKKALVQFAVAALLAVVLGVGAVAVTVGIVASSQRVAQQQVSRYAEDAQKAKAALEAARRAAEQKPAAEAQIVVAAQDIAPGQILRADQVMLASNLDGVSGGLTRLQDVVGRTSRVELPAGEPLTSQSLLPEGDVLIPAGLRAMAIQVDPVSGLAGSLHPGDRVDVLATLTVDQDAQTRTLIQGALVLSTLKSDAPSIPTAGAPKGAFGQPQTSVPRPAAGSRHWVMLAVRPPDAERLALANQRGEFHLALRRPEDTTAQPVKGMGLYQLVGKRPPSSGPLKGPAAPVMATPMMPAGEIPAVFPSGPPPKAVSSTPALPAGPPPVMIEVLRGPSRETMTVEGAQSP